MSGVAELPAAAVEQLLGVLRWRSTVFHVGQYCGSWKASTADHGRASFHLVLRGACVLHRPGQSPLALQAGDAVFFAGDEPHQLGPVGLLPEACSPQAMQATLPVAAGGIALACGFLQHDGPLAAWLLRSLPRCTVLGREEGGAHARAIRALFELMLDEADRCTAYSTDRPSPAMARLADLLLLYLLRHAGAAAPAGPWALACQRDLAPLIGPLLADPGGDWTAERMAARVHLSRAAFFRRFQQATGEAPAQFVLRLRMALACDRLQQGDSVERAAEHAGFGSTSAFHRAFVRVMGEPPGRYARSGP